MRRIKIDGKDALDYDKLKEDFDQGIYNSSPFIDFQRKEEELIKKYPHMAPLIREKLKATFPRKEFGKDPVCDDKIYFN